MKLIIEKLKSAANDIKDCKELMEVSESNRKDRHLIAIGMIYSALAALINILKIEESYGERLVRRVQNARFN